MSSLVTLNGGTLDNTNSTLNVNKSNIILMQNYGISGGITDISRNMFTITNSSISIKNINNNLGFNNIWTGKNTFKGDVSFINTNTIIDASNTINLRSSTVNISGGLVNISGGTITLGSSNIVLPNIQPQKKNNVVFFDTVTSALSYGTATSFSDDVSFNNAKTQINSTSVVGLSGGVVNISGGIISLGSSNIILPNIQSQKKNNVVFFDTVTSALSYGTATSFSDDVSFNNANTQINSTSVIGLSGGVVNISGGTVNISGGPINIGAANLASLAVSGNASISGTTTVSGNALLNGTTTVSGNTTFNNSTTQINSTGVIGLSGGVINICGGAVNIGSAATFGSNIKMNSNQIYLTNANTFGIGMINSSQAYIGYGTAAGNANVNCDNNGNAGVTGSGAFYIHNTLGASITNGAVIPNNGLAVGKSTRTAGYALDVSGSVIINNGNVGIGTTAPRDPLHINNGSSNIRLSGSGANEILFDTALSGYWHNSGYGNNPTTSARGAAYAAGAIKCFNTSGNNYEDSCLAFHTCLDPKTDGTGGLGVLDEKMRITSNGSVGIGTTSPATNLSSSKLSVIGGIDCDNLVRYYQLNVPRNNNFLDVGTEVDAAHGHFVFGYGDKKLTFGTNGSKKMTILSNGNVGIGTASPGAKLEVLGNERTSSILVKGTQPGIVLNNTSTNGKNFNIWSTSSADGPGVGKLAIYDETSGAYRMLINESGNVGIGTISPNTKLELKSSLSNILNKNFGTNSDARWSSNWGLSIVNEYTDNNLANASNTGNNTRPALGLGLSTGLYPTAYITSLTPHGFNGWNPLMIDGGKVCFNVNSFGNVGIGTDSPEYKLEVNGYMEGGSKNTNPFRAQLTIKTTSGSERLYLGSYYSPENACCCIQTSDYYYDNGNYLDHGNNLALNPLGGNVGIGTTSPEFPLEIANVRSSYSNGQLFYGQYSADNWTTFSDTMNISLKVNTGGFIWTRGIINNSDTRIKKNIIDIDDSKSLTILRQIKPKTYEYIDKVNIGSESVIGFIAQEIKEIIPKAVSIVKEYIPNFYTLCQVSATDAFNILLVTSPIDLSWNPLHSSAGSANASNASDQSGNAFVDANGNACSDASGNKVFKVKLYDQKNNEIICKTKDILDKRSFLIDITETTLLDTSGNLTLEADGGYFLYGQEVDDFHTLDKNAIFTVVTAAVQDIDRIVQAQAGQIQASQTQIQQEQQADKAKIQELENKVAMLEQQNLSFQSQTLSLQSEIMILQNKNSSLESQIQSQTSSLQEQITAILAKIGM